MRGALRLLVVPGMIAAQQPALTLDLGTSRMRFADSVSATAVSVSPAVDVSGARGALRAFGTFSKLSGAWSNSGSMAASLTSPSLGLLSGEIEGTAGGSAHSDGGRTGQLMGSARLHVAAAERGLWIGVGAGRTWDGAWRGLRQGSAGAWLISGFNAISASLSPTQVADTIRYADAVLGFLHARERWELGASVATRSGSRIPNLPANTSTWGNVGGVVWLSGRAGIAASAGTYPVDFAQGYPGGRFMTLSVRMRSLPSRAPAVPGRREIGDVRSFSATRVSAGRYRITVRAPAASSVDISGDFTSWEPVALTSDGRGSWSAVVAIPDGVHEVNLRVDRGSWGVPPGLPSREDEFGAVSGVLVVPQ